MPAGIVRAIYILLIEEDEMKKNFLKWGMPVLVLVFAVSVVSAAKVPAFEVISPIEPDEKSAVVYFVGSRNSGNVWDGETAVGSFYKTKLNGTPPYWSVIAYKTTPGSHIFMANGSNWVATRAELEPNKSYFLRIDYVPVPFAQVVIMSILGGDDGLEWLRRAGDIKDKKTQIIQYTDAWRTAFVSEKLLKKVQEELQEAQGRLTEIDLSGKHGI